MESNQLGKPEDSAPHSGVIIEPYSGPLVTEQRVDGNINADDAERPTYYIGLNMVAQAAVSLTRGWAMLLINPFIADDKALSWAKQGTAWIALAWLIMVGSGDSGLFYWSGGCIWLLFVAPAIIGLFNIVRSAVIVRHSSWRLAATSIIILGLTATVSLLIASVSVSKEGELLGNLEECCCYLCVKAAVEWYNSR